jgi:hypothetical protein
VVLFQKLFKGYIVCFLGDSIGQYIFEQFAHETNLKKKRSVSVRQNIAGFKNGLFTCFLGQTPYYSIT